MTYRFSQGSNDNRCKYTRIHRRIRMPLAWGYQALLVYYWFLLFLTDNRYLLEAPSADLTISRFSLLYCATVFPLWGYLLVHIPLFIRRWTRTTFLLAGYAGLVVAVSLIRLDLPTAYNVILMVAPLILARHLRVMIPLRLLQTLLLLSVVGSVCTYLVGNNPHGLLPGQSALIEGDPERGLWWRVSLYPGVAESAFFALIVLQANRRARKTSLRLCATLVALYFLLLGGVRTTLLAWGAVMLIQLSAHWIRFRHRGWYLALFISLLVIFMGMFQAQQLIVAARGYLTFPPVIERYVFRQFAEEDDPVRLRQTIYREWLWAQHLRLFWESPLIGHGTFTLEEIISEELIPGHKGTGSESMLTGLLARSGLMTVPFGVAWFMVIWQTIKRQDGYRLSLCLIAMFASLGYGSFLVPYSFIWLLLAGELATVGDQRHYAITDH